MKGYTEAMTNIAFGMTVGELVDILKVPASGRGAGQAGSRR